METLKKILDVPANHQLHFDVTLPNNFPLGPAEVVLVFASKISSPITTTNTSQLLKLAGSLKNSLHFSGDPLAIQKSLMIQTY